MIINKDKNGVVYKFPDRTCTDCNKYPCFNGMANCKCNFAKYGCLQYIDNNKINIKK
jgi:hypothetical protein